MEEFNVETLQLSGPFFSNYCNLDPGYTNVTICNADVPPSNDKCDFNYS